jgi:uncharacterized protein (UPF0333 family)
MPVFASFSFGDALLTMLEFALLVMWIWVAIGVILDIFRSRDMGGGVKALWVLLIVILPLIGVLIYLIARGHGMHERQVEAAAAQQKAMDQYIRTAASTPADDIAKLEDLHSRGVLSDDEFQRAKAKTIS